MPEYISDDFSLDCRIIADTPTINGRVYPKEVMEMMNQQILDDIKNQTAYVHCRSNLQDTPNDMTFVAAQVTDSKLVEGKLDISMRLLDLPMGRIAKDLLELGTLKSAYRISPNAFASIRRDPDTDQCIVNNDVRFHSFDILPKEHGMKEIFGDDWKEKYPDTLVPMNTNEV